MNSCVNNGIIDGFWAGGWWEEKSALEQPMWTDISAQIRDVEIR